MRLRPHKWLLYAPLAVLPYLAALLHQGPGLEDELTRRLSANLAAAGAEWAAVIVDGRDVRLTGTASAPEQVEAALAAVRATPGVRTVRDSTHTAVP